MAKHIHLIGICGSAMASLAGMLQTKGYRVTGSDAAAYPPMSDLLKALGIPIMEPYAEKNLSPRPDLVIVGNAISRGNLELEAVLDQRIPFRSLAETIQHEFLPGKDSLVVAGTHGKTTTTSMLAWIYEVASRDQPEVAPSFLIGGIAENFGTSFHVREGKPFILEGDEYDTAFFDKGPKFMHYFPDALILTHVEFDHADIYDNLDAVKTAFRRLVNLVPRRGRLIAYDGSANVDECVARAFCSVERYGFKPGSAWRLRDLTHNNRNSSWKIFRSGREWLEVTLPLAGEHNALNATAAAALAAGQGIDAASIVEALSTFRSVKRRLEVRAVTAGVTIIDDFAHHPTAIRETLKALRAAYPGQNSGPCSSHGRTRCVEMSLSANWWRASRWRTESSWPAFSSRRAFPRGENASRKGSGRAGECRPRCYSLCHRGRHRAGAYASVEAGRRRRHSLQRRL